MLNKKDYEKLNSYLNKAFNILQYSDAFLINNCINIDYLCDDLTFNMQDFELEHKVLKNNLTYEDVFIISRDIISKINPSYLSTFDNLIKSGELDFSYDWEYQDSQCICFNEINKTIININRNFNYHDVLILIHEFIHYTNIQKGYNNLNNYLLTEFISIYFELYATLYLIEIGVEKSEIDVFFRINNLIDHKREFEIYSPVFIAFEHFGSINEESYKFITKYVYAISKDEFDKSALKVLKKFETIEQNYRNDIMFERHFDSVEYGYKLSEIFKDNYRYVIGNILGFYAIENCNMEDIVYLNDHINSIEYRNKDIFQILKSINIDFADEYFVDKIIDSMKKFIKKVKTK